MYEIHSLDCATRIAYFFKYIIYTYIYDKKEEDGGTKYNEKKPTVLCYFNERHVVAVNSSGDRTR